MYLSKLQNVFVQIAKCICPNPPHIPAVSLQLTLPVVLSPLPTVSKITFRYISVSLTRKQDSTRSQFDFTFLVCKTGSVPVPHNININSTKWWKWHQIEHFAVERLVDAKFTIWKEGDFSHTPPNSNASDKSSFQIIIQSYPVLPCFSIIS